MYHYVRSIRDSQFPGIKGLELDGFRRQLDYLEDRYSIVSSEQVIDSVTKGKSLPPNSCWLTFDDGYKDHYVNVLPELLRRNLPGAFFPPRVAIQEAQMLNVNSVHYILSCANQITDLVNDLNEQCRSHGLLDGQIDDLYKDYGMANRFDDAATIYVKRMLQVALPEGIRRAITSSLFEKYVGESESEFSEKLYMNVDEVGALVANGMYVGSHGSMHYWLDSLDYEQQREDISTSLEFLEDCGASTSNWIMCYPYGAYNEKTLSLLTEFGASLGLTTEVRKASIGKDNPLTLPRFDTNDFPQ